MNHLCTSVLTAETTDPLIWGMPRYLVWIVIIALLILTGLFSACENAFSTCNKYHFRAEADKGKRYAKIITNLVDNFDQTLITILVMSNSLATLMSFLSAMCWYQICTYNHWSAGLEVIFSTIVMGFLFYVIADTIPKVISKAIPNQIAIIMAYPLHFFQLLLFPIIFLFQSLLRLVHKALHLKDENLLSKEEILYQASEAINDETIIEDDKSNQPEKLFETDEKEILNNVLSFDSLKVEQIYTPLKDVFSIDLNGITTERVNQAILATDYSRIPVYDKEKSNIIGVLVVRSYFEQYMEDKHLSIPSILENVVTISIDTTLDDALKELNSEALHLAVVKKDDKVLGVITMDDILEKLVHDIDEDPTMDAKGERK